MGFLRPLLIASAAAVMMTAACGGDNGTPQPPPAPSPTPPPAQANPCEGVALERGDPVPLSAASKNHPRGEHVSRWRVLDELWKHEARADRGTALSAPRAAVIDDIGELAVIHDQGDLILPPNPFDLEDTGLRFSPNGAGGYDAAAIDANFRQELGSPLSLEDDDSTEGALQFDFRFYGRTHRRAFVNSDGNLTFDEGDDASTSRDVSRLLAGPPRVAPFLADLDPSAGGRIFLLATPNEHTVTWCNVPGFDSPDRATLQVSLLPGGVVEMKFDDGISLDDAVVGVSPGRTGNFRPVDFSASPSAAGGSAAVGERFARQIELDLVALGRAFYSTHADIYDQLVVWGETRLTRGSTFAFEITAANEIEGIGLDIFDTSRQFGSGGRLRSVVMMDDLGKYPEDPARRVLGEDSTLSVLGHETGHRWLALLQFRDQDRRTSTALLGRDLVHWSFFFDSDGSFMEGNDIEDLGGGAFRTVGAVDRYSRLDQYAMGFLRENEVPPFFYVESPVNVNPMREFDSAPRTGVTFNGTRRTVLIQDVIAALGPRRPAAGTGPRLHRQAFIFVVGAGRTATAAQLQKLERIRSEWVGFYERATGERGRVETRISPPG